jgi:hypothetical protein
MPSKVQWRVLANLIDDAEAIVQRRYRPISGISHIPFAKAFFSFSTAVLSPMQPLTEGYGFGRFTVLRDPSGH